MYKILQAILISMESNKIELGVTMKQGLLKKVFFNQIVIVVLQLRKKFCSNEHARNKNKVIF